MKKIWNLGNEIGEYEQEKDDYLDSDGFALHVCILIVVYCSLFSLRARWMRVAGGVIGATKWVHGAVKSRKATARVPARHPLFPRLY